MSLDVTPEQMARYRATARRRQTEKARQRTLRRQRAWEVAHQAGQILKEQFGARKVVLFGSALFAERFHERSDIDVAVWGIDERDYYRAVSRLLDIDPTIAVDLVEAEFAPLKLLAVIEQEGVEI